MTIKRTKEKEENGGGEEEEVKEKGTLNTHIYNTIVINMAAICAHQR